MLPTIEDIIFIKEQLALAGYEQFLGIFNSKRVTEARFRKLSMESLKEILPGEFMAQGSIYEQIQKLAMQQPDARRNRLNQFEKDVKEVGDRIMKASTAIKKFEVKLDELKRENGMFKKKVDTLLLLDGRKRTHGSDNEKSDDSDASEASAVVMDK